MKVVDRRELIKAAAIYICVKSYISRVRKAEHNVRWCIARSFAVWWSGQDLSEAELSRWFRYRFAAAAVQCSSSSSRCRLDAVLLRLAWEDFPVTLREDGLSRGLIIYYIVGWLYILMGIDFAGLGEMSFFFLCDQYTLRLLCFCCIGIVEELRIG